MKSLFSVLLIALCNITLIAQQNCTDVIFPVNKGDVIDSCCVLEVNKGKVVLYEKNGQTFISKASAINMDGELIKISSSFTSHYYPDEESIKSNGTYKNKDYDFYYSNYKKASSLKVAGIITASVGVGLLATGFMVATNVKKQENYDAGSILYLAGIVSFNVGVPLLFIGSTKAQNNWKAMEECKRNVNLSLGINQNGAGIVLRF